MEKIDPNMLKLLGSAVVGLVILGVLMVVSGCAGTQGPPPRLDVEVRIGECAPEGITEATSDVKLPAPEGWRLETKIRKRVYKECKEQEVTPEKAREGQSDDKSGSDDAEPIGNKDPQRERVQEAVGAATLCSVRGGVVGQWSPLGRDQGQLGDLPCGVRAVLCGSWDGELFGGTGAPGSPFWGSVKVGMMTCAVTWGDKPELLEVVV